MFNLQGSEIIFILLIALVVLGPEKLPGAIRKATQTYAEFRKMSNSFQSEFKSVIDEPLREMRETADLVKETADPKKMAERAEAEAEAEAKAAKEAAKDAKDRKKAEQAASVTNAMQTGGTADVDRSVDTPTELTVVADPIDTPDEVVEPEDEFADPVDAASDEPIAAVEPADAPEPAADEQLANEDLDVNEHLEDLDDDSGDEVPGAATA